MIGNLACIGCGKGWPCLLCNTGVMCYFSVAMEIVYGKLGAIRVVTSQLGFARPFFIEFFARNVVPTVIQRDMSVTCLLRYWK